MKRKEESGEEEKMVGGARFRGRKRKSEVFLLEYLRITDHDDSGMSGFLSLSSTHIYRNCADDPPPTSGACKRVDFPRYPRHCGVR